MEYKKYPNHLTHFDKKHKDYIPSERDDKTAQLVTEEHNKWIDDIKRDLTTQKKIHDILTKMDRPYLRGAAGSTRNITAFREDRFLPTDVPAG